MTQIADYLKEIAGVLARGDATEHTYRPAFKHLIESLDQTLVATNEPRRVECGAPDFIITRRAVPIGYVEAKDIGEPLQRLERSDQLDRYRKSLGNLVLTDYLAFRWYVNGELRLSATLGELQDDTHIVLNRNGQAEVLTVLTQFLSTSAAVVSNPQELAQRLAGMARLTRFVLNEALEREQPNGPLREQINGFRAVLLPDLTAPRFADIYAQTIVYGLFAARSNAPTHRPFTRARASYDLPRTNPFLRRLFNYIAGPELDASLDWVVDDVADLLDRTDIGAVLEGFGQRTQRQDPVFHFYETFLASYDPTMREALGVYYTPEPVVSFIVRSADRLLKRDFGLQAGLAHSGLAGGGAEHSVLILDPAVGTGTFLYEVIALIEDEVKRTLGEGVWGGANGYVAQHLLPRIFGFEYLMAPYTVAHMKLGLQLRDSGYDFLSDRRLGIYLTNTLETGGVAGEQYQFVQWLRDEAGEANAIKRDRPVMVVLGNPPYSGHSANNGPWIAGLLRGVDTTDSAAGTATHSYFHIGGQRIKERNPKWLNADEIKFIRFSQWRIERSGSGIIAFITSHGYLDNPTFRAMRRALLDTFDEIYVLDLHGNAKKRERAPDGTADQNVFDIQQGVAIGIFVKRRAQAEASEARVHHAHLFGLRETHAGEGEARHVTGGKYHALRHNDVETIAWTNVNPTEPFFSFIPRDPAVEREWNVGLRLPEIMPVNTLGFQTHRDKFAIDFDRGDMRARLVALRGNATDEAVRQRYRLKDAGGWSLSSVRARLRADPEWERPIIQCLYRPFDVRWTYFSRSIMDRPRRELLCHVYERQNLCLLASRQQGVAGFRHSWAARLPAESCVVSTATKEQNYVFPVYLYPSHDLLGGVRGEGVNGRRGNFAPSFVDTISEVWGWVLIPDGRGDLLATVGPEDLAAYIYALLSAPPYRVRYADFLQQDFPRVFVAPSPELARSMIAIGHTLLTLHLLEGEIHSDCRLTGVGNRLVEQVSFEEPVVEEHGRILINEKQAFEPVASEVWDFEVGGFQVCPKWLDDRRGRQLSINEVETFRKIIGAISETLRLMIQLEDLFDDAGGLPFTAPAAAAEVIPP